MFGGFKSLRCSALREEAFRFQPVQGRARIGIQAVRQCRRSQYAFGQPKEIISVAFHIGPKQRSPIFGQMSAPDDRPDKILDISLTDDLMQAAEPNSAIVISKSCQGKERIWMPSLASALVNIVFHQGVVVYSGTLGIGTQIPGGIEVPVRISAFCGWRLMDRIQLAVG